MSSGATVEAHDRLRLFCALRLPESTLDELVRWQEAQVSGGRVVPREHLHITLAFLGTCPAEQLAAITQHLREAAAGAKRSDFVVRRYRETPRVGMLAFTERGELSHGQALAYDVQERMERLGIRLRERRPWLPHVTVVRFREPPRLRPPLPDLGVVSPSDAAVYHSALRPDGAQYTVLESVALGG